MAGASFSLNSDGGVVTQQGSLRRRYRQRMNLAEAWPAECVQRDDLTIEPKRNHLLPFLEPTLDTIKAETEIAKMSRSSDHGRDDQD
jgi:hypothetical protein